MKVFYTIIKIAPNTLAGDTLSLGLLLFDGGRFRVQFSEERKNLVKKLLEGKADIVDFVIKQIMNKVNEMNLTIVKSKHDLFIPETIFSSDRFLHISQYSNGMLRFTEPILLNDNITDEKFNKLFALLIDKHYLKPKPAIDSRDIHFKSTIETNLIKRVEKKVHTNLDLTPGKINGLYYNFTIDCIGLNGSFTAAKAIPFHKKYETIDKEISHYISLTSLLKSTFERKSQEDNFYIIGDEPDNIESKEHKTWESLKKNPIIKLLHSEESGLIAQEIDKKGAKTFLKQ